MKRLSGKLIIRIAIVLMLGGVVSKFMTSHGIFGTDYIRASVIRVISTEQTRGLPRCLVTDPNGREHKAIIRRGDNRQYQPGDRVTVCLPFGPPHIVAGVGGLVAPVADKAFLPCLILGLIVLIIGIVTKTKRKLTTT